MARKKISNINIMNTNNRCGVNLTICFVTALFLSLAIVTADVTFTTRIKHISSDLGKALNRILELDDIVYTNFTENPQYVSEIEFNPKGMTGLYNITHIFMDFIQAKEVFPKDFQILDNNGDVDLNKLAEQWPSILKHYAGLLTVTIIGLLFAVLMPLVGFVFCCCRCCGNCGARSQPFDKKHDMCKKVILATLLIGVATLLLFGVVCAFVSNQHMQDGTEELPHHLRNSVADVSTYITNTDSHIKVLMIQNYDELQNYMIRVLNNSTDIITKQLFELSKAVSFSKLQTFVIGLNDITGNLTEMQEATKELRIKASQLNDGLRRVKHELLHTLKECSSQKAHAICDKINNEVGKLGTTVDFDSLPDVNKEIKDLQSHLNPDLITQIEKANKEFEEIPTKINEAVSSSIPTVTDALKIAGDELKKANNEISLTLRQVNNTISKNSNEPINTAEKYIKEYSVYRYYIGLGVSSLLLLVIVCVTLGLMCGICGKRPDGYDDDCCNKGAGSKFLMIGVAIMFLFAILLMAVTLIYFLSGVILQRLVCDTLRDPRQNKQVFDVLDQKFKLHEILGTDMDTLITECHTNKSAYIVLNLEHKFNVSEIPDYLTKYNIDEKIKEFQQQINYSGNLTFFDNGTLAKIHELRDSSVADLPIHRFVEILENNLTNVNLNLLADELEDVAEKLMQKQGTQEFVLSIKHNVMYLRMYQKNLVDEMNESAKKMTSQAEAIEKSMKFGHYNFTEAIDATLSEVLTAQTYLNDNAKTDMKKLAEDFGDTILSKLKYYLNLVKIETELEVGRCAPLSNVYNNTLTATCDKILNPWNGFWISAGWCLLLFIPTIVLSVKLSTLYQKSDPYPGPLVEHEYLYDAYADRDNIPLSNSGGGKKGKKKKKHRGEVYETRGYQGTGEGPRGAGVEGGRGPPVRERDAPGGSAHPDTRYADMAPKHWEDYPNGGPPQYQTAAPLATEYERPPPYYYPGPGDRP